MSAKAIHYEIFFKKHRKASWTLLEASEDRKVAIERNLEIVPRSTFADVTLGNGDRIEIVQFVGGG